MVTKKISFEVTGEFVTKHARALVQENKVREAERFLLTSIIGLTHDHMVSILRGEKKMVGSSRGNTLSLEDDDPTEMTKVIDEIYAGVVHDSKNYWKPYAQVTGWGAGDVGAGEKFQHPLYNYGSVIPHSGMSGGDNVRRFNESRNVAYMNNKQQDLQHILLIDDLQCVTLWERVDPPPFWIDIAQGANWQQGLDNFLAAGKKLNIRDHSSTFDDFYPRKTVSEVCDDLTESDDESDGANDGFLGNLLKNAGIPSHAAKGMMQFLSGKEDDSIPVAVSNTDIGKAYHGFILKDGRFYACEYHNHASLAARLFKHLFNMEVEDPEKEADKAGWIRIQKSAIDGRHSAVVTGKPTRHQKSTFSFWAAMHDFDEKNLSVF